MTHTLGAIIAVAIILAVGYLAWHFVHKKEDSSSGKKDQAATPGKK